jgi:hypothetical protein
MTDIGLAVIVVGVIVLALTAIPCCTKGVYS